MQIKFPISDKGEEQVCGDDGYVVSWDVSGSCFNFSAKRITGRDYNDNSIATLEDAIEGGIKWDGCANIQYYDYAHYCSPSDLIYQHRLLRWLYEKAKKVVPNNEIEDWPTIENDK